MDKEISPNQFQGFEETIYNISDLLLILRIYCSHHGGQDEKIDYIGTVLEKIAVEFEKISRKF